jgi:hypothetical protein
MYKSPHLVQIGIGNPDWERVWITPNISDFNCTKREISLSGLPPALNHINQYFCDADIDSFMGSPLSIIGLEKYVDYQNLLTRGESMVSTASPLNVMSHPSSRSHIARTSVARLEQDISNYGVDENESVLPVLKFTVPIERNGSTDIKYAIDESSKLLASLYSQREKDIKFIRSSVRDIINFCNGLSISNSPDLSPNECIILAHALMKKSGYEATLVIYYIFLYFDFIICKFMVEGYSLQYL